MKTAWLVWFHFIIRIDLTETVCMHVGCSSLIVFTGVILSVVQNGHLVIFRILHLLHSCHRYTELQSCSCNCARMCSCISVTGCTCMRVCECAWSDVHRYSYLPVISIDCCFLSCLSYVMLLYITTSYVMLLYNNKLYNFKNYKNDLSGSSYAAVMSDKFRLSNIMLWHCVLWSMQGCYFRFAVAFWKYIDMALCRLMLMS